MSIEIYEKDSAFIRSSTLTAKDCTCKSDHPHLDEAVLKGVNVHFEAMGDAQFWIGIDDPVSGRRWSINCGAVDEDAHGYARIEED